MCLLLQMFTLILYEHLLSVDHESHSLSDVPTVQSSSELCMLPHWTVTLYRISILWCISKSGWPSGLRRCVQVAVYSCRRGFESHFWHIFASKMISNRHNHYSLCKQECVNIYVHVCYNKLSIVYRLTCLLHPFCHIHAQVTIPEFCWSKQSGASPAITTKLSDTPIKNYVHISTPTKQSSLKV